MTNIKNNHYDAIGIGYGPSNLAIAVAYENLKIKYNPSIQKIKFFDKKKSFDWHPGLLLDGANMQITFMKDLITLKDPTSKFTFLSYLKETNSLEEFINLRVFYPTRIEFRNYFKWVASKLSSIVEYNSNVSSIIPIKNNRIINYASINYTNQETGKRDKLATKNIILATGGIPKYINGISYTISNRIIHSSDFLKKLKETYTNILEKYHFLVVGGGQSAAEMYNYLYTKYPNSNVSIVTSNIGFKPADDSEFVNELFNQSFIDEYYNANKEFRNDFLDKHYNTNYSVVDSNLIKTIYNDMYVNKRLSNNRLKLLRFSRVIDIKENKWVNVIIEDTVKKNIVSQKYHGVFLGTGYDFNNGLSLLKYVQSYMIKDQNGQLIINRDYSIKTTKDFNVKIFLQGPTEISHGLSSVLLSVLPYRAHEILNSINLHI